MGKKGKHCFCATEYTMHTCGLPTYNVYPYTPCRRQCKEEKFFFHMQSPGLITISDGMITEDRPLVIPFTVSDASQLSVVIDADWCSVSDIVKKSEIEYEVHIIADDNTDITTRRAVVKFISNGMLMSMCTLIQEADSNQVWKS